VKVD
jgi:hypothetical protein